MPKCWFVLLRFWLRVDDTLVRLREARLFCATERPDEVLREVKHSEGAFEELAAAGAPANNVRALLPSSPHALTRCPVRSRTCCGGSLLECARMRSDAAICDQKAGRAGCSVWAATTHSSP